MKSVIALLFICGLQSFPMVLNNQESSMFNFDKSFDSAKKSNNNWSPVQPGEVRSPCPMLNTLANHELLPHSGKKITYELVFDALNGFLGLDEGISKTLAETAVKEPFGYDVDGVRYVDLYELQLHGV